MKIHFYGDIFAEHGYARELDMEKVKKRFKFCTGGNYEDFYRITYLDKLPEMAPEDGRRYTNPSKYLMWQELLAGLVACCFYSKTPSASSLSYSFGF